MAIPFDSVKHIVTDIGPAPELSPPCECATFDRAPSSAFMSDDDLLVVGACCFKDILERTFKTYQNQPVSDRLMDEMNDYAYQLIGERHQWMRGYLGVSFALLRSGRRKDDHHTGAVSCEPVPLTDDAKALIARLKAMMGE